jgi:hypothetical protein
MKNPIDDQAVLSYLLLDANNPSDHLGSHEAPDIYQSVIP